MYGFRFVLFFLMWTPWMAGGCKKNNTSPSNVEIPQAPLPHTPVDIPRQPTASDDVRAPQQLPNPKIKALGPEEEVTCASLCSHLAYCNRQVHQKETSATALSACIGGCTRKNSESDKRRWEAMEKCAKKNPGEACTQLRVCLDQAMLEIQKELHGKTPQMEKQP